MLCGRPAGLQRPACPAAVAPSRWRRPGVARAWIPTRTRTAAAGRQRGSARPLGTARRRLRRRCGRSRAAVRVGGQLGSALPPQRRRVLYSPSLRAPPGRAGPGPSAAPPVPRERWSGGDTSLPLCRCQSRAASGVAGARGSRGGALGGGSARRWPASCRGQSPFPGRFAGTAGPVGGFPLPCNCFPPKVGVDCLSGVILYARKSHVLEGGLKRSRSQVF